MNFDTAYQQYLDESDPDYHHSMQDLFRWFFNQGIEASAQVMEIQSPHVFVDPDYLAEKIRALAE